MNERDPMRPLRIIWMAMVAGTATYTGIVYAMMRFGFLDMEALPLDVMNLVGPIVIVQLFGSLMLRRRMVAAIPSEADAQTRLSRYANASIVGLALLEGGGLLVITFGLLTGSGTWVLVGGGASVVLMLLARPTRDEIGV